MVTDPAPSLPLLARQSGMATRRQLCSAGWSPDAVRAQLDARRWRSLNELVVCTHNGPLTSAQARWAAVLSGPQPIGLSGVTVLWLAGVRLYGSDEPAVHVVVRRGARVVSVAGVDVVVHESRRFAAQDVTVVEGLPATSVARAALDAAAWTRDAREAARIVVAAVQQRRVRPVAVRAELDAAGAVRHRKLLAALLDDFVGGAEALSEVEFLAFCRRHGLPRPTLQHRLDSGGRRRYLDAVWRLPDGSIVRVEIDGGVHLTLTARWRDTAKDNESALAGQAVLRFPSAAIYTDDPLAVGQLRRALQLSA